MLRGEEGTKRLSYWKDHLSGTLPRLSLATDQPRSFAKPFEGATRVHRISSKLSKTVKQFAKSQRIYLSTAFLGIFKLLLHRYTGERDIIVGMAANNRPDERFNDLIGFFIDMLPVRSFCSENESFLTFLKTLQSNLLNGLANAYPFPALVRDLNIPYTVEEPPVFQVSFIYQDFVIPSYTKSEINPARDRHSFPMEFADIYQAGEYEISLEVFDEGSDFKLHLKYNPGLFSSTTISRLLKHYIKLLEEVISNPNMLLNEYPILTSDEQQTLLIDWNHTQVDYPKDKCIHELFEQKAKAHPESIAVVFEDTVLTYDALDKKSTLLARYLREIGVRPDTLVGICVERSLMMITGLLGIIKSGGAYVPLDPEFPKERLSYMVRNSKASIILSQSGLMEKVSGITDANTRVIFLDKEWRKIEKHAKKTKTLKNQVQPHDLAYVIYTSGSTGKPKGVMIPHQALTNFLMAMGRRPGLTSEDRLLAVTTYSFDIAWLELFLPLVNGARCYICTSEKARDPELLKQEIQKVKPTIIQATPITFSMLFQVGWQNKEKTKILCGGEALTEKLKNQFMGADCDLWNMFGPTETTVWSTIQRIKSEAAITIGKPIANTQIYILDKHLKPTPMGVPGELCIAGHGLAAGYLNRPALTAEKFIENPFTSGTRLYRTGDLARWLSDGHIEFMGRMDHQVKIRGYRIELGEIENHLRSHSDIRECVVIVKKFKENKQLVAYYVSKGGGLQERPPAVDSRHLREHLKSNLPGYMIPAIFIAITDLIFTCLVNVSKLHWKRMSISRRIYF